MPRLSIEGAAGIAVGIILFVLDKMDVGGKLLYALIFALAAFLCVDAIVRSDWTASRKRKIVGALSVIPLFALLGAWIFLRPHSSVEKPETAKKELQPEPSSNLEKPAPQAPSIVSDSQRQKPPAKRAAQAPEVTLKNFTMTPNPNDPDSKGLVINPEHGAASMEINNGKFIGTQTGIENNSPKTKVKVNNPEFINNNRGIVVNPAPTASTSLPSPAARGISKEVQEYMIGALSSYKGQSISVFYPNGDLEAKFFASQLAYPLDKAGMNVQFGWQMGLELGPGVTIFFGSDRHSLAQQIYELLQYKQVPGPLSIVQRNEDGALIVAVGKPY